MTALMTVLGILVFAVGLGFSIAWHELGHLATAKLFGVRVPQYMVGFGPTIWSLRRGETEYGVKAIPLGGYIRMIGMFPPSRDGRVTRRSTSPWRGMIEQARSAAYEDLLPGDESRMFYTRKPWQRVIVMFAGPFMNLLLAVVVFTIVLTGFGVSSSTTTVSTVSDCVVSASTASTSAGTKSCPKNAPPSPAKKAGLRPGDTILRFDGSAVRDWSDLQRRIRGTVGPVTIVVQRAGADGHEATLHAVLIRNQVPRLDGNGNYVEGRTETAGFLGFSPASGIVRQSPAQVFDRMGEMISEGMKALVGIPEKIPGLWGAAFQGAERAPDSPVGVVGAARVGGEVFTLHIPAEQRIATMLMLVAGFNLSLFLFNMVPLLPLDGGHVVGALWEALRRNLARLLRRPDPGPFDVARLMPVAYVVAGLFVCFTVLVLIADLVNPVQLS
jgi:membrane-associated protease RseP (regulator of RpoE activity)